MPFSMTGYARSAHDDGELSLVVTLRSVNHRFLDLQVRIPPQIEPFEVLIRRRVKERLKRGQLQLSVSLGWKQDNSAFTLNRPLLDAYVEAHRELAEKHGLTQPPDLSAILRVPGALTFDNGDLDDERRAKLEAALTETLDQALEELKRGREVEAAGIVEEMQRRAASMEADLETLRNSLKDVIPSFQLRLEARLTDLFQKLEPDSPRLMQEAALLAERADISEEVQRLGAHVARLLELLQDESELGKKIDFLAQEMNREANTILSKTNPLGAAALEVTQIGLRLKGEVEKIREQAQNLE